MNMFILKSRPGFLAILFSFWFVPTIGFTEPPSGIAPLKVLSNTTIKASIPPGIRTLITPLEQQNFFRQLEGSPPNWLALHNQPGEEHGERIFSFNRTRDEEREDHPLLKQRIAFLWSGVLRKHQTDLQGFTVAMGPVLTQTAWGIVRFKPVGLPNEMIAVPPSNLLPKLKAKVANQEEVEIVILFVGKFVPNESLMYAFSHDGSEEGMIMPFVQIETVHYFLK